MPLNSVPLFLISSGERYKRSVAGRSGGGRSGGGGSGGSSGSGGGGGSGGSGSGGGGSGDFNPIKPTNYFVLTQLSIN